MTTIAQWWSVHDPLALQVSRAVALKANGSREAYSWDPVLLGPIDCRGSIFRFVTLSPFRPSLVPQALSYDVGLPRFLVQFATMPKHPQVSSTVRRQRLCEFIESFGDEMVKKCSTCVKHSRVCKVHVRSGKCSECLRRGQRCDVRVTESEFKRLATEKEKLRVRIKESREAQNVAMKASEKAIEDLRVARAREERLRQQMDLLDRRAEEAIAVEERSIEEQERAEAETITFDGPSEGLALNLSPSTWSAFEGWPFEYWETPDVAPSDWLPNIPSTAAGSS